ncbi:beta-glucosidase BglX [Parvularcula marina]|uniref:beta-glucosidase BglX n=2 Tax=Parvularcula marina TaxID=2292771 RepID=UPI003510EE13
MAVLRFSIAIFISALVLPVTSVMAQTAPSDEERVEDLLSQMTLKEKVGQVSQFTGFWDVTGPAPTDETQARKAELLKSGIIGSMLNVVGVEEVRPIQEYALNSRLGIPVIFGLDVVHGHKTMFPIPLAEAASWDLDMIEQSARVSAIEAAAQGQTWTFAPMVDISRDPRWGRVMEGAGEDPYLGSRIAVARIRGFQGDDLSAPDTIVATLKHFAGYGFAESGKDYNTVDVGTVTLHNVILPPFKAGVEEADARTVMNGFNTLNGLPVTGDGYLQRELLKGEWGFDGFVVSDWASAREMIDHGYAKNSVDAALKAMEAGSDMDMESYVYLDHLEDLVDSGTLDVALLDDAVRRILRVKFELGLFDDPYKYLDADREAELLLTPAHREASLKMAERSIVLLKNDDDTLPIRKGEKIVLIGTLAADKDSPLGNWRAMADDHSAVSVVEAFEAAGLDFVYAEGAVLEIGDAAFPNEVVVNLTDRSGFPEAVEAARNADKVIIVLGEDGLQSGEGRSRSELGFPGVQQELLEAVYEANPETALVVMSGRPLVLTWAEAHVPAIVQAWHLGQESGHALTNVLTGAYNPSGKLPMTFPRSVGQIPIYYSHLNTGRPGPLTDVFWSHYIDESNAPLWPFGYGLSYTTFEYSNLRALKRGDVVEVSVRVKNTGSRAGEEVVQLYIRDIAASVSRPVRELKDFSKIELAPGKRMTVTFELGAEDLGFYNANGSYVVEPGDFEVFVGGSSDATLSTSFEY